jgi:hypothetical protein
MRLILIRNKWVIAGAAILTFGLVALWQVTGGDFYTKYEVVVTSDKLVDPNDPLAAAGFYSGSDRTETVIRDEFRFGLLPTSVTPFDKHFVALSTMAPAIWVPVTMMLWWSHRRRFLRPGLNNC